MSTGMKLVFEIPALSVFITFGISGFTVDLPYQYFGNNTQGHCGRSILFSYFYFKNEINDKLFWIIFLPCFEKSIYWNLTLLTGTCNNNQADDCRLPSGQLVQSCALMADYWPVEDTSRPECKKPTGPPEDPSTPPTPPTNPCTTNSMCNMLNSRYMWPDLFFFNCKFF